MNLRSSNVLLWMFCSKGVTLQKLHCECHTLPLLTIFTQDELYKMYLIMRDISCGRDIFSGFLGNFQQVTIAPTHVSNCLTHWRSWISVKYPEFRMPGCDYQCFVYHIGCINNNILAESDILPYLKQFMVNCYDFNDVNIDCIELATYFPQVNIHDSEDSDDGN